MKRIFFVLIFFGVFLHTRGQEIGKNQVLVSPNGLTFKNGENYLIIESDKSKKDIVSIITGNLNTNHLSKHLKIDTLNDAIVINDFVPGYTKSDKTAGSAYLIDLTYRINVDVKENRYRINVPTINLSANQKYESDAVTFNKGVQFNVNMGIKGKRDVWNSKEKKMFIYDEKDKLIEKSTKEKLERDLSSIINIITKQSDNSNW